MFHCVCAGGSVKVAWLRHANCWLISSRFWAAARILVCRGLAAERAARITFRASIVVCERPFRMSLVLKFAVLCRSVCTAVSFRTGQLRPDIVPLERRDAMAAEWLCVMHPLQRCVPCTHFLRIAYPAVLNQRSRTTGPICWLRWIVNSKYSLRNHFV
jgi:hypothetical protein